MIKATPILTIFITAIMVALVVDCCHHIRRTNNQQAQVDSVIHAGNAVLKDSTRIKDSIIDYLTSQQVEAGQAVIEANRKLDSSVKRLAQYDANSRRYANGVKKAKQYNDTFGYIQNCDALAASNDSLQAIVIDLQNNMTMLINNSNTDDSIRAVLVANLNRTKAMYRNALANSLGSYKALAQDTKQVNGGKLFIGGIIQVPLPAAGPAVYYQFPGSGNMVHVAALGGLGGLQYQGGVAIKINLRKPSISKLLK
jgi:hypothetical protein